MILQKNWSGFVKKQDGTQEELAEQMNVSRQSVSKWEGASRFLTWRK